MKDATIRVAFIGEMADKADLLPRLRGATAAVTAESTDAALQAGHEFDAAVVGSLADAHGAVAAGKHVLVSTPFANSMAEAESLIQFSQESGVTLAFGGLPRHTPASRMLIDRLETNKLGDPGLLRVHRWCSSERSLSSLIHGDIDLALCLFRAAPTEVYAIGRSDSSYYQVHLGFPAGGMALLDFARRMPAGQAYDSLSLIGSRGAAYVDDHHNTHLLFKGGNPTALISDPGNEWLYELREFLNCIAHGLGSDVDGKTILEAHRVTDAVVSSVDSACVLQAQGGIYGPA